eukprot:evm.model.scf_473.4 EVM.evm.TU.scf_473.4   scf_473:5696-8769(+)
MDSALSLGTDRKQRAAMMGVVGVGEHCDDRLSVASEPSCPPVFLLLNKAYELLCDGEARQAYDALHRGKLEREERLSRHSDKRRCMMEELKVKEWQAAESTAEEEWTRECLKVELQQLRKKMEDKKAAKQHQRGAWRSTAEPTAATKKSQRCCASFPNMSHIIKVTWIEGKHEVTEQSLRQLFNTFGPVSDVVMRKTVASTSKKKRKHANSALVVLADKEAAVHAVGALKDGAALQSVALVQKGEKSVQGSEGGSASAGSPSCMKGANWESQASEDVKTREHPCPELGTYLAGVETGRASRCARPSASFRDLEKATLLKMQQAVWRIQEHRPPGASKTDGDA